MRRSSRPAVRWFAAGLTVAASAWPALPAFAAGAETEGTAYSYATPAGESFFAVAVRAHDFSTAYRPADRHVVLVDTSASQAGEHRQRAFAAVESLLSSLPADATVSMFAIDVAAEPLTDGFVPAAQARDEALTALRRRVPLGATDFAGGLKEAIAAFGSESTGSVVYVGDGMSAANLLRSGELKALTDTLRGRRIPVHAYAVGPDTDWRLLGVLAHQTGGIVERDAADAAPSEVGRRLGVAAALPVVYPEAIASESDSRFLIGDTAPPLRGDRETILVGRGEVPADLRVTVAGKDTTLAIDEARAVDGLPTVRAIALSAERSGGLDMPAAGKALFAAADAVVERSVEELAAAGVSAARTKDADRVAMALASLEATDPAGQETARLRTVLAQVQEVGPPEIVPPPPAESVAQNLIGAEIERQRILTQQITVETNAAIDQARQIRQSDPGDALNLLKRVENTVRLSTDIDPEARANLLRRLNNEIVITANLQEKLELDIILRQERLAQIEGEQRMIQRMLLEEEELEQLIERVRALIDAGRHGDDAAFEEAVIVALDAVNLRPGNGPAMAAAFQSYAADSLNKAFRLRALRSDRFLETLYQVELSHVPFPDEPPIVYPAPEVWKALTERRRKFASVSLESTSPAEEKIRAALDEETSLEFPNTPLRTALQFLGDAHEINIVIKEQDLADDAISIDDNIDIVLSGITLRSALKILLEDYGLTYVIEDEVMKITTQTIAEDTLSVRVYPVGDLVIPITTPQAGGLGQGLGGAGGIGGQGGGGQFGGGGLGGGGGGGLGGGGVGGGGFFSVPAPALPQDLPRNKAGREVPQASRPDRPLDDAEMQDLLDGVLDGRTTAADRVGQAFASVRDVEGEAAGKKK